MLFEKNTVRFSTNYPDSPDQEGADSSLPYLPYVPFEVGFCHEGDRFEMQLPVGGARGSALADH